jgi:flagellar motor protein MotB
MKPSYFDRATEFQSNWNLSPRSSTIAIASLVSAFEDRDSWLETAGYNSAGPFADQKCHC